MEKSCCDFQTPLLHSEIQLLSGFSPKFEEDLLDKVRHVQAIELALNPFNPF